MNNVLKLEFEIAPSVNHYLGHRAFLVKGKPQVSVYVTTEAKKYKKRFMEYVKEQVGLQGFHIIKDKFAFTHVDVTWYFPRIDLDSNNQWKLILDSLTEIGLWNDDNTVLEKCKRIYYDSKNPRMVLEIYYSDYVGIFDNQSQFDDFMSSCIRCTRYRSGKCSIIKNALESRVQEEISELKCIKYNEKGSKIDV